MKKKSTYRLLVQSEERSRNILETAVYGLFAVSALVAIWQFVEQPSSLPTPQGGSVLERHQESGIPS